MHARTRARYGRHLLSLAVTLSLFAAVAAPSSGADALTPKERDHAVKYLEETRDKFLASIEGLSEAQWKYKPAPASPRSASYLQAVWSATGRL
jgi:hypothetical protein